MPEVFDSDYAATAVAIGYVIILFGHFFMRRPKRGWEIMVLAGGAAFCAGAIIVLLFIGGLRMGLVWFCTALIVFGIGLYVFLCEWLLAGLATRLTKWRGEKWVKEIDYVYLLLGLIGVLGTVNRLDAVTGRISQADILWPMVLTAAIVIRLIKTRADIAGWNKS